MLKKRIVATLVVRNGIVVQSCDFNRYKPVGNPTVAMKFLDDWGVDEIILLDISATKEDRAPNVAMVVDGAAHCRVPLTVGGGVKTIEHVLQLMHSGADKVSINQAALIQPSFLAEIAKSFGSQCVVASIDAMRVDGECYVYDYLKHTTIPMRPWDFARHLQDHGAGEIFINSVDRDGSKTGFDLELINEICSAVSVPVICCGGAGKPQDILDALTKTQAGAVAAGNFFHFIEHSVTTTKAFVSRSFPIRHETYASYADNCFDNFGRLLKKDDADLESLLYERIQREII